MNPLSRATTLRPLTTAGIWSLLFNLVGTARFERRERVPSDILWWRGNFSLHIFTDNGWFQRRQQRRRGGLPLGFRPLFQFTYRPVKFNKGNDMLCTPNYYYSSTGIAGNYIAFLVLLQGMIFFVIFFSGWAPFSPTVYGWSARHDIHWRGGGERNLPWRNTLSRQNWILQNLRQSTPLHFKRFRHRGNRGFRPGFCRLELPSRSQPYKTPQLPPILWYKATWTKVKTCCSALQDSTNDITLRST